jgi:hypothetical protein
MQDMISRQPKTAYNIQSAIYGYILDIQIATYDGVFFGTHAYRISQKLF